MNPIPDPQSDIADPQTPPAPRVHLVLAIEPDPAQAAALRDVVVARLGARLEVVTSKDAALRAMAADVPDLMLLSTLLAPRDEEELIGHLRGRDDAAHLQTLTIPPLGRQAPPARTTSLFGLRWRKAAAAPIACDPAMFAEQVAAYLAWAAEVRSQPPVLPSAIAAPSEAIPEEVEEPWRSSDGPGADAVVPAGEVAETPAGFSLSTVEWAISDAEPGRADVPADVGVSPLPAAEWVIPAADVDEGWEEIELALVTPPAPAPPTPIVPSQESAAIARSQDLVSETMAHFHAGAEAALAAELDRVRREAEHRHAEELAKWQADADALREAAVDQARAAAEAGARDTLAQELARAREEAERTFADALNRVKQDAAAMLAAEVSRAHAQAEEQRRAQLHHARAEAETEAEARLASTLVRVRQEVEEARLAGQSEAEQRAEQIRQEAAREARAVAEQAASATLHAEVARIRIDAEARLASEVTRLRADADQRRNAEMEAIRAQIAEVKAAAAQQLRVVSPKPPAPHHAGLPAPPAAKWTVPPAAVTPLSAAPPSAGVSDYYGLWGRHTEKGIDRVAAPFPRRPVPVSRGFRWAVPLAATLALVTSGGLSIDTASWRLGSRLSAMGSRFSALIEAPPAPPVATVQAPVMARARPARRPAPRVDALPAAAASGWLAIASRIPLEIHVDDRLVGTTQDGQLMVGSGRHDVTFVSEHFNYRHTETLEVRPGFVTPYTVTLPFGSLRVSAPAGTQIWIEGERVGEPPLTLSVPIGSREIVARRQDGTEQRQAVEVRADQATEVVFDPPVPQ